MERVSNSSKKNHAVKRSREAVVCHWNVQRVVPRRVNGKITYEIVTGESPQRLFPSAVLFQPETEIARRQHLRIHAAGPSAAIRHRADTTDIRSCECHGNRQGFFGEGRSGRHSDETRYQPDSYYNQDCRPDVNGSSDDMEGPMQSWDRRMSIGVGPSSPCVSAEADSSSRRHNSAGIQRQSTAEVLQCQITGVRGLEASTHSSSTVILITYQVIISELNISLAYIGLTAGSDLV